MTQIPDFFHALEGWRKFECRVHSDANGPCDAVLFSVAQAQPFPSADIGRAFCMETGNHPAPELACTCGYYAYKTRSDALAHSHQGRVLARVEVSGRIAEHERGYRAARMTIIEIFVPEDFPARSALEARYHRPVTIDKGVAVWTLADPSASSSQNHWQTLSISQYQNSYHQALQQYGQLQQNQQGLHYQYLSLQAVNTQQPAQALANIYAQPLALAPGFFGWNKV
jgi:hypothetical protein